MRKVKESLNRKQLAFWESFEFCEQGKHFFAEKNKERIGYFEKDKNEMMNLILG